MADRKVLKFELSIAIDPNEDALEDQVVYRTKRRITDILGSHMNPMVIEDDWRNTIATGRWVELKQI